MGSGQWCVKVTGCYAVNCTVAATRLIPLHIGKGSTIAKALGRTVNYAENKDKTENLELVSGYGCDPKTAENEFLLSKRQYFQITGRSQGSRDVIAYHTRQSFKPGEVTPEEANAIGYELAMRFTKGRNAFIVATHIDKAHIHSHIIINSTNLDCTGKFRNFYNSYFALRRLSDLICLEHGLSIIEDPKPSRGHYGKWMEDKGVVRQPSLRDNLKRLIDETLPGAGTLDNFLAAMNSAGYEVKRGKHIALKGPGQKRFIRLSSLGSGYSEQDIISRLTGREMAAVSAACEYMPDTSSAKPESGLPPESSLLSDIQRAIQKVQAARSSGRGSKIYALKQTAKTLVYLQEAGLTDYSELERKSHEASDRFNDMNARIKGLEAKMSSNALLRKHIGTYIKTRPAYAAYRKAGYSKRYGAEHESEIILHQAAKDAFDKLGLRKLPSIASLREEYAIDLAEKKRLYAEYVKTRTEMKSVLNVKANVDKLLRDQGKDSPLLETGKYKINNLEV